MNKANNMNNEERIANGECISPRGVDHCPTCSDRCEAFHWKIEVSEAIKPYRECKCFPGTKCDSIGECGR